MRDPLFDHVILRVVVGSRAYGLDTDASDTDRRGCYLPPAERHWSFAGVPEQLEDHATQETYWELEKFLRLALKANPNVLECLYSPLVEHATPLARRILDGRRRFLSRRAIESYGGYVDGQFRKQEADRRAGREVRWKRVMHLLRLLIAGTGVLRDGDLVIRPEGEIRARLLAVRAGEVPTGDVERWHAELQAAFDAAAATTRLPAEPDVAWAEALLIEARRSMV